MFSNAGKRGHLCRRPNDFILRPHGEDIDRVAEAVGRTFCPLPEFTSRPLETMILVPHFSWWEILELNVVFSIGCRHDNDLGPRELEEDSLKCN